MNHKEHWENVAALGCCVSARPNPTIHHCKGGSMIDWFGSDFSPRGTRCHHFLVIPLDAEYHTGSSGIDVLPVREWESTFGTQVASLMWVQRQLDYSLWELAKLPDPNEYGGPESYKFGMMAYSYRMRKRDDNP